MLECILNTNWNSSRKRMDGNWDSEKNENFKNEKKERDRIGKRGRERELIFPLLLLERDEMCCADGAGDGVCSAFSLRFRHHVYKVVHSPAVRQVSYAYLVVCWIEKNGYQDSLLSWFLFSKLVFPRLFTQPPTVSFLFHSFAVLLRIVFIFLHFVISSVYLGIGVPWTSKLSKKWHKASAHTHTHTHSLRALLLA